MTTSEDQKIHAISSAFTAYITKKLSAHFLVYVPATYNASEKWPVLFFLHGAGERGDSLDAVKTHGPPEVIENGSSLPFIVVAPQCPENQWWPTEYQLDTLDALFKEIDDTYSIDASRIYLTGLSMGGYGTWAWATRHPHRFAAIAPVCGAGDPHMVKTIAHLPVWVFHGAQDDVVAIEKSQEMVDALKAIGNPVRFTVYPEAGHDSWTETYNNPELYTWFLSHVNQHRQ